nr:hypothetical protein [Tanacetum cinerariifolium]
MDKKSGFILAPRGGGGESANHSPTTAAAAAGKAAAVAAVAATVVVLVWVAGGVNGACGSGAGCHRAAAAGATTGDSSWCGGPV